MNTESEALADAIAISLDVERKAAGWTLGDLAQELGLSEQTLGRYLTRRERSLPVDVLTAACAAIDVPVGVVVSRARERMEHSREVNETADRIVAGAKKKAAAKKAGAKPAAGKRNPGKPA